MWPRRGFCTVAKGSSRANVERWLSRLEPTLSSRSSALPPQRFGELFAAECFWRDMVAFTWNIATFEGRESIGDALNATHVAAAPSGWRIDGEVTSGSTASGVPTTDAWLAFETAQGCGRAHVRLDGDSRARTLLTTLQELHGHPFAIGRRRRLGTEHGPKPNRQYWHEQSAAALAAAEPYVLIIGGGQGGLSLGARLQLLGVPYLIVERHEAAGDSWRTRYPSLCLHDPVWYDHMPYLPFPPNWPVFTPRDKMADWLKAYVNFMDLLVWTSSTVRRAVQLDNGWQVEVERGSGEVNILRPTHVVFACGMSGYPRQPHFEGADLFEGTQLHSSKYEGGRPWVGTNCVVVGSNTSAHDVCQDLWEQGARNVTMLQRSASLVVSTNSVLELALGPLYSEEAIERGIQHEMADALATTLPYRLQEPRWREITQQMRARDAVLYRRLEEAGFSLDFGPDDTGIFAKSLREGGGFYIDVGCAELICDGRVGLRSGTGIARLERDAVLLESGERLPADLVVYATGYGSMHRFVADIVSEEVAEATGRVWGMGAGVPKDPAPWEGELRNMWKPTAVERLWFTGGNLAQSRHYSRLLALQLQARYLGLPTPVYPKNDFVM